MSDEQEGERRRTYILCVPPLEHHKAPKDLNDWKVYALPGAQGWTVLPPGARPAWLRRDDAAGLVW